jgi:uncharacterized membrane protein YsdA (DUF1294 family)
MEEINSIFTTQNILIYILIINVITFFMMWFDKHEAKIGDWRVPERTLFLLVLLGGGIGGIAGMYVFRHKTRKWYFKIGFPAILIMQIILVIYLKNLYKT